MSRFRRAVLVASAYVSCAATLACGHPPHPPVPCPRAPALVALVPASGPYTIDVRVHVEGPCVKGSVRALTVTIDAHPQRLELPCWRAGSHEADVIAAPGPSHDARPLEVDAGAHTVAVRDEDTGRTDLETFEVPHVEPMGDGMVAGQHVDVWVSPGSVSVRGPTAFRVPAL